MYKKINNLHNILKIFKKGTTSTYSNKNRQNFQDKKSTFRHNHHQKKCKKVYYEELTDSEVEPQENQVAEGEKVTEQRKNNKQSQNKREKNRLFEYLNKSRSNYITT